MVSGNDIAVILVILVQVTPYEIIYPITNKSVLGYLEAKASVGIETVPTDPTVRNTEELLIDSDDETDFHQTPINKYKDNVFANY